MDPGLSEGLIDAMGQKAHLESSCCSVSDCFTHQLIELYIWGALGGRLHFETLAV